MKTIKTILFIFLISLPFTLDAGLFDQAGDTRTTNPQNILKDNKSWGVNLNAGGSFFSGNLNQSILYSYFTLFKKYAKSTAYLESRVDYFATRDPDVTLQNRADGTLRLDYELIPKLKWFAFTTSSYNEFLLIDYRFTGGTGPWYNLFKTDGMSNDVSLALTYEYEEFKGYTSESAARISFRDIFNIAISSQFNIGVDFFYVPKIADFEDYHIYVGQFIEFLFYKNIFGLKYILSTEYDSIPKSGIEKSDLSMITALTFYFGG